MAKDEKQEIRVSTKGESARSFPLASVLHSVEDMERRFERLFSGGLLGRTRQEGSLWDLMEPMMAVRWPSVDLVDRDNEVVVRAEIPGVDKKDLDVSMTDNTLTIKGQMRKETKEEKDQYFRSEIVQGNFSRSVYIPADVDSSKVNAVLKDGVLEITLPKLESSKRRSIKVQ